jgi:DNA-binding CsgD family transcriptional regulator
MSDAPELDPLAIALYRRVLIESDATAEQLAASLEYPVDKLDKHLARLIDMGVLRCDDDRYVAISPMLAEATVLGAEDLELAARRADLELRRNAIRTLVPEWNLSLTARTVDQAVDLITDPTEISSVMMHFADQVREETLSVRPGVTVESQRSNQVLTANHFALQRGIRIRALYEIVALRDRATVDYLGDLSGHGAKIRFTHAVPGRLMIFDREVALLPLPATVSQASGLAVVREPSIVAWAVATFEQLWTDATGFEEYLAKHVELGEIDATRRAILRLMADGDKDEAIARKLSISVRTARRHIAEYMAQVGADSRFQAGVIAARTGHIDDPVPESE